MSTPGTLGLFLACILLALSAGLSLLAETARPRLLTLARFAFHGAGAVVFWCLMLLFSAFLLNDFSIRYVVGHSSLTTPWYYRLSALWAGPEGTLFLWLFLILAAISAATFQIRRAEAQLHRRVILIGSMITLPLLAMILFFANPFAPKLIPVADGMGLNPMLRDWAMIIHPPILFAGYACLAVAFILATSRFDDSVGAQLLARWARLACGTLTAGIVTGALWAYDELGWGGYWGWDPVENASLIPWLISFALLHFSSRQATIVTRSAVMLSGLAFAGTIVATYLTRSGVVFSLHAFADNSSANVFLLALGIVILFTVIRALRTPRSINPLPGTMTLTMWWLIMMTLAVLIGTLWPVWAKMMIDNPQPLPASFYNTTVGLMGLGLMITLGVCSSRSIRRPRRIEVLLIAAALASVTCFTLWFFLGRFELLKLIGLFVLVADAVIIVFDMAGRRRQFLHRLPMTIAHLGLIVLSFGLLASLAQPTVKSLVLEKQQADKTGGLQVRLDNLRADERKDGTINVQADLEVSMPYRQETLHPSQTLLSDGRHRIEPDFRAGLFSDIYAVLEGFSGTQALVSVRRNWLVGWVWGGSGLILIGCLLATANRRRAN